MNKKYLIILVLNFFIIPCFAQILKPQKVYIPIYKFINGAQIDSIINDVDRDLIPIITVIKTKRQYAYIEYYKTAEDSLSIHNGWIKIQYLGINPSSKNDEILLRKSPSHHSPVVDVIKKPVWGDLYNFTRKKREWLFIRTVIDNGEVKTGWMAPEDQNANPLAPDC